MIQTQKSSMKITRITTEYFTKIKNNPSIIYYLLSELISKLIPVINVFLFLYFLSIEEFGELSNLNVIYSTAALFISNSVHTYYISQYYEMSKVKRGVVIRSGILISFLITILLFFIGILFLRISSTISFINTSFLFFLLSASFINSFSRIFFNHLRINSKAVKYFRYTLIFNLFLLITTFQLLYFFNFKTDARVYSIFYANIILFFIGIYVLRKYLLGKILWPDFKEIFFFGIKLIPHNLSFFLKDGAYKFLITAYIGITVNAYFSLIIFHVFVVQSFNVAYFNYYSPILIKKISNKNFTINSLKKELFNYGLMISLISLMAGISLYIYIYYFKLDYHAGLTLIKYIIIYSIFYSITSFTSIIFFVKNKPEIISIITFLTTLIAIIITFLFLICGIKKIEIILFIMILSALFQFYISYHKGFKLLINDN